MKKTMEKITLLSLSLMLISTFTVSTVLPAMLGFYQGYGQEQVELLISIPSLAITVMILMNTWLARYINESVMITTDLVLLTVNGVVPVFFQNYPVVLISRGLFGFGIGLINARAITMISERYEGNEKKCSAWIPWVCGGAGECGHDTGCWQIASDQMELCVLGLFVWSCDSLAVLDFYTGEKFKSRTAADQ